MCRPWDGLIGAALPDFEMVPVERIELPTFGLQNRCSTAELNRQLNQGLTAFLRGGSIPAPDVPSNTRVEAVRLLGRDCSFENSIFGELEPLPRC